MKRRFFNFLVLLAALLTACSSEKIIITAEPNDRSMGRVSGGGEYYDGDLVTLKATALENFTFNNWDDGNTDNPRSFIAENDCKKDYTAFFGKAYYSLIVQSADSTMGSVRGGGTFPNAISVTIKAIPNEGNMFSHWNDNDTNDTRPITVTCDATYIAYFISESQATYTITVQSANASHGQTTGSGTFHYGEQVVISATPYSGYTFNRWHDGNTDAVRTVTVTGNATYIAYFLSDTDPTYTITVTSANPSQGTVSGGGTYNQGDQVTIRATPNTGFQFSRWNDNNTNAERTFTCTGNASYTAYFETRRCAVSVLSADENKGYCTGSGAYNYGQQVTVQAIPYSDYSFSQWQDGNTNATRTIRVTDDITLIAYFTSAQYTITVQSDDPSQGTVSGGGQYGYGDQVTITATPNPGYAFDRWNDNNTNATRTITVTGNATYTAYFEPVESLSVTFGSYSWSASTFIGAYYTSDNTFVLGGRISSSTSYPWFRTQLTDITSGTYYYASYDTIHYFTDSNINLVQYYDTAGIVDGDGYEYGPWQLWNVTVHIISINSAASTISFTITGTMVNLRQLINTSAEQATKRTISVTANNIHYTTSYSKGSQTSMQLFKKNKANTLFPRKKRRNN